MTTTQRSRLALAAARLTTLGLRGPVLAAALASVRQRITAGPP